MASGRGVAGGRLALIRRVSEEVESLVDRFGEHRLRDGLRQADEQPDGRHVGGAELRRGGILDGVRHLESDFLLPGRLVSVPLREPAHRSAETDREGRVGTGVLPEKRGITSAGPDDTVVDDVSRAVSLLDRGRCGDVCHDEIWKRGSENPNVLNQRRLGSSPSLLA